MHKLLHILKKEQTIYNTVFHELIRQVSVDCADRGELLSKIRLELLLENSSFLLNFILELCLYLLLRKITKAHFSIDNKEPNRISIIFSAINI